MEKEDGLKEREVTGGKDSVTVGLAVASGQFGMTCVGQDWARTGWR